MRDCKRCLHFRIDYCNILATSVIKLFGATLSEKTSIEMLNVSVAR